jgi:hypothetical protein
MKNLLHWLPAVTTALLISHGLVAQEAGVPLRLETMGDAYLPNAHNNQLTSSPYISQAVTTRNTTVFTMQVNVNEDGENILGDAANEPSIAINPLNKNEIVIGWRQFDNVSSNFRQAGWSYSSDGGQTWTFPGVLEPGVFRSDPVLDFDSDGRFYYNSLTLNGSDFECRVFRSADGGATWDAGVDAYGGDKQWMTIDRTGGTGNGNIYSFWTQAYSICEPEFFTRSTDGGDSYEACVEVDGYPYWGTMAVGKEGELYIVGGGYPENLVVAKSTNAQVAGSPVDWDLAVNVDVDGAIGFSGDVNPSGLLGQANIDVDVSDGAGQGYVYVLASVIRTSNSDPGDVMFARSTDGGYNWDEPVRVNDDVSTSNTQWFGTLSVAPDGRIDAVWLDTRDASNAVADSSALYYSYSLDQGQTWSVNEKLSDLFNPHVGYPNQNKLGDYFDMVSDLTGIHLAWANTLNGEQDVYYSYIMPEAVTSVEEVADIRFSVFPNPSSGEFFVTVPAISSMSAGESLLVEVTDLQGRKILSAPVAASQTPLDLTMLPGGIYLLHCVNAAGISSVQKIVKE